METDNRSPLENQLELRRFLQIESNEFTELTQFKNYVTKDGVVGELHIPGPCNTVAGYLKLLGSCCSNMVTSAYVMCNKIDQEIYPAIYNEIQMNSWIASKTRLDDDNITNRRVFYIDVDPKKRNSNGEIITSKISATDEESAKAWQLAVKIREDAIAEFGDKDFFGYGCSGNGHYVYIRIFEKETPELREKYTRLIRLLKKKYDNDDADIDGKTFNAARIMPAPGTMKCKGGETETRKHRMVWFKMMAETDPMILPIEKLWDWADKIEQEVGPVVDVVKKKKTESHSAEAKPVDKSKEKKLIEYDVPSVFQWGSNIAKIATAKTYISKMPEAIQNDGGDRSCYLVAWRLATKFKLDEDEIFEILVNDYNPRCVPAWSDSQLRHKAQEAVQALDDYIDEEVVQPVAKPGRSTIDPVQPVQEQAGFEVIWNAPEHAPEQTWINRELELALGWPAIIGGPTYSGKTLAIQSLFASTILGMPIWGMFKNTHIGKCIHFDFEQGAALTEERYHRLCLGLGTTMEAIQGKLGRCYYPEHYLDDPGVIDKISKAVDGCSLALIDSLKAALPNTNENDSSARNPLDMLGRITRNTGCLFILAHHTRKPTKDSFWQGLELRGTGAFEQAAGGVIMMSTVHKDLVLSWKKCRSSGAKNKTPLIININDTSNGGLSFTASPQPPKPDKAQNRIIELESIGTLIIDLFISEPMQKSKTNISKKLDKPIRHVSKIIDELVIRKIITPIGVTSNKSYILTSAYSNK